MRRLALLILLAASLVPSAWRSAPAAEPGNCQREGRGEPPRLWLGCATDEGAPRDLSGDERLLMGLPIDPNRVGARELAFLPGLSVALAEEVVLERQQRGAFRAVDDLLRVRGIGPKRLARARHFLEVGAERVGVADRVE
jgi:competence protein ComEA